LQGEFEANRASGFPFEIPDSFKIGSLDSLVTLSDDLTKLDTQIESVIRKVERQYMELDTANPLQLEKKNSNETIKPSEFVNNFQWSTGSFPISKSLQELTMSMSEKLSTLDDEVKIKTAKFIESRNELNGILKKEAGNLLTKELAEVLTEPVAKESDFHNSEFMKTVLIIVPKRDIRKFLTTYEELDDGVVPRSALQFEVQDKDDLTLWRIVVKRTNIESFTTAAKHNKWSVRDFEWKRNFAEESKNDRDTLEHAVTYNRGMLHRTCVTAYTELFVNLTHLKALRVFVEAVLRFSLPPNFFSCIVYPEPGREKRL
jgi:V-type H+-transporting ATPase subunit C